MIRKNIFVLCSAIFNLLAVNAQTVSLDSCRAMALRSNKQLSTARLKQEIAQNAKKAAHTKYLPHVDVMAGWELTSREISILSNEKKENLTHLGTNAAGQLGGMQQSINNTLTNLVMNGDMTPNAAQAFGGVFQGVSGQMAAVGDAMGERIVNALRTDTRSLFAGSVMVTQPIYMGGAITAANDMADAAVAVSQLQAEASEQAVLYNIDQAYWTVVSLRHKQQLADKFLALVQKFDSDVQSMIRNGVATRADGLKVAVRVNEAEMTKTQVENGLALAKMYLCQLCGLPLETEITLADEGKETLSTTVSAPEYDKDAAIDTRPELQMLSALVDVSEAGVKMARASNLPQIALTGGYLISNPNVYNGYENKFGGVFNVGVMLRVPVFDWGEGACRVRAARMATNIARMDYEEAREKIELQVTQCDFRLREANKKLVNAQKNIQQAEENLRCANLGFEEGVMQAFDVMAAQTAWLQAQTQHIDAEIDVRLSEVGMKKALNIR